jgi:ankyrin repeat protein
MRRDGITHRHDDEKEILTIGRVNHKALITNPSQQTPTEVRRDGEPLCTHDNGREDNVKPSTPEQQSIASNIDWPLGNTLVTLEGPIPASDPGPYRLYIAASEGDDYTVHCLLRVGASPNIQFEDGKTALHAAVECASSTTVRALLEFGASTEFQASGGWTPIFFAVCDGETPGQLEIVRMLHAHGADLNARSLLKNTPLLVAAQSGCTPVLSWLLSQGADIAAQDARGNSALHKALEGWHTETALFLIEQGVDFEVENREGDRAVHCAAQMGAVFVVAALMDMGAELAARNLNEETPLFLAVAGRHVNIVRLIIQHSYLPGSHFIDGYNILGVLFFGMERNDGRVVIEDLLDAGLDVNAPITEKGHTPLFIAVARQNCAVVEMLLGWGADPYVPNEDGITVFDLVDKFTESDVKDEISDLLRSNWSPTEGLREKEKWYKRLVAGRKPYQDSDEDGDGGWSSRRGRRIPYTGYVVPYLPGQDV